MATSRINLNGRTYRNPSSKEGSGILTYACNSLKVNANSNHLFIVTAIDPNNDNAYYVGLLLWKYGTSPIHSDISSSGLRWGAANSSGTVRIDGGSEILDYTVILVGGGKFKVTSQRSTARWAA